MYQNQDSSKCGVDRCGRKRGPPALKVRVGTFTASLLLLLCHAVAASEPVFFSKLNVVKSLHELPQRHAMIDAVRRGEVFIVRSIWPVNFVSQVREYLTEVGKSSFPEYRKLEPKQRNFHRILEATPNSFVPGTFHQFSFFPWNTDALDIWRWASPIYRWRDDLHGFERDRYMKLHEGNAARVSVHFFPKARGNISCHIDPVGEHQEILTLVALSKKGVDFDDGGYHVAKEDGSYLSLEDVLEPGDLYLHSARMGHCVHTVDASSSDPWLSFVGRWSALLAVNKMTSESKVGDATPLELSGSKNTPKTIDAPSASGKMAETYSDYYIKALQQPRFYYPTEWVGRSFLGKTPFKLSRDSYHGKSVLDLGFGDGRHFALLDHLGMQVFGTEISPEIVESVIRGPLPGSMPSYAKDGRHILPAVSSHLPFASASMDFVLACHSFYHTSANESVYENLREVGRVLKPGGRFHFSFPTPDMYYFKNSIAVDSMHRKIVDDPFNSLRINSTLAVAHSKKHLEEFLSPFFSKIHVGRVDADWFGVFESYFTVVATRRE